MKPGLIVTEWIEGVGGAEKVLKETIDLNPAYDVACLWSDVDSVSTEQSITQSFLSKIPHGTRKVTAAALSPAIWRMKRVGSYEKIVVLSHLFSHHVSSSSTETPKYVYVHSPARYIWEAALDTRGAAWYLNGPAAILRKVDKKAASTAHSLSANSRFVRDRIARCWDRESQVIYPPVDVTRIASVPDWTTCLTYPEERILRSLPDEFVLGASRLVPYKRLEDVIRAGESIGVAIVIAGDGPDYRRLTEIARRARTPVIFLGRVSDPLLYSLYQQALAFVFPPVEDFGIMPVEAMAAGAKVLANQAGGSAESVVDGVTGASDSFRSTSSIRQALERAIACDSERSKLRAEEFRAEIFRDSFKKWLE